MDAPEWICPAGVIRGWRDGDVVRATGIPYATTRRFAAPEPVLALPSPFDATRPTPVCPQRIQPGWESLYRYRGGAVTFDEDCTGLSITMPADAARDEALPVMVWFHGGSYVGGAADLDAYDPRRLVAEQRVVVVGVTYRLGILGYLGRGDDIPANLGLLDQVAAVQWVARNIAAFGGDPGTITLFGESAGADAVAHLMIADGSRGLFRRAILQSPPLGVMPRREGLVAAMGDAVADLDPAAAWESLADLQERAAAAALPFGVRSGMPYGVRYGTHPLPAEDELDDAWSAVARDVDVLIGRTAREGALFVETVPQLQRLLSRPVIGGVTKELGQRALTELVYARPLRAFARRHHEAGGHGYRYHLTWGAPSNFYRAGHTADLPLLLGTEGAWSEAWVMRGLGQADIDRDGPRLRAVWGEFARTGRLRPGRLPGIGTVAPLP